MWAEVHLFEFLNVFNLLKPKKASLRSGILLRNHKILSEVKRKGSVKETLPVNFVER